MSCHVLFPQESETNPVVLGEAAELGKGAHFVQLGGWAALARFDDDRPPLLVLAELDSTLSSFELDTSDGAGELDIVGVWGEALPPVSPFLPAKVVALGCNEAGCQLLAAAEGDDTLRALPGYELAATVGAKGIVGERGRLCVYGDGLYCAEGDGWSTVLPATASGRIVAASLGNPAAVATVDGRLLLEDPESGVWSQLSTAVGSARSLDSSGRTQSVLTDDGGWVVVSTDPDGSVTCEPSPPLLLASPGTSASGVPWLVVDEHAVVFRQRQTYSASGEGDPDPTWCIASPGLSETLREVGEVPCNAATNLLAISDDRFYSLLGKLACPVD